MTLELPAFRHRRRAHREDRRAGRISARRLRQHVPGGRKSARRQGRRRDVPRAPRRPTTASATTTPISCTSSRATSFPEHVEVGMQFEGEGRGIRRDDRLHRHRRRRRQGRRRRQPSARRPDAALRVHDHRACARRAHEELSHGHVHGAHGTSSLSRVAADDARRVPSAAANRAARNQGSLRPPFLGIDRSLRRAAARVAAATSLPGVALNSRVRSPRHRHVHPVHERAAVDFEARDVRDRASRARIDERLVEAEPVRVAVDDEHFAVVALRFARERRRGSRRSRCCRSRGSPAVAMHDARAACARARSRNASRIQSSTAAVRGFDSCGMARALLSGPGTLSVANTTSSTIQRRFSG